MRHLTCDPNVEVIGQTTKSYLENIRGEYTRPIIEAHGLTDIDPNEWYPAKSMLDAMNELAQQPDFTSSLVAIGLKIAENLFIPPQIASFDQILEGLDVAYHSAHRNGDIGHVRGEKVEDGYYRVYLEDIYPDDMTYGIIYGLAKRLLPSGTQFSVKYDEGQPNRDRGGDKSIVHVRWG